MYDFTGVTNIQGNPLTQGQQLSTNLALENQRRAFEQARLGMGISDAARRSLLGSMPASQLNPELYNQGPTTIDGVSINPALADLLGIQSFSGLEPQRTSSIAAPQGPITAAPQGPIAQAPQQQQSPQQAPQGPITASPQGPLDVQPGVAPQGEQVTPSQPVTPQAPTAPGAGTPASFGPPVQGGALWKPVSESDGNLVVLFPYQAGNVVIRDAASGEVIDVGRSTGPSNGYGDTIRFSRPGAAYKNVIIEDQFGNRIAVKDGAQRIEGIPVTGYGFPQAQQFVPPALAAFQPIEATKKPKIKKGPKRSLRKADFQAAMAEPKAPTGQARGVEEFVREFQKQRGQ